MAYQMVGRHTTIYTPKPEATPASKGARRSNRNRSPMSEPVESANARRVTRSSWKRLNKDKNESITQPQGDGKRLESESSSDVGGSSSKSRSGSDSSTISSTTKDSAGTSSSQDNSKSPRLTGTPSRKRQCIKYVYSDHVPPMPQPPPPPIVLAPACEKICTDSDHLQIPMVPSGKLVLPDGRVLKTGECIYAPWPTFTGFEALKETTRASGAEKGKSPAQGRTRDHSSSKNKRKKQE